MKVPRSKLTLFGVNADPTIAKFEDFLRRAVGYGASDIHFKSGLPPIVRIHDTLQLLSKKEAPFSAQELAQYAKTLVPSRFQADLAMGREVDMAYGISGVGRFRLNIFRSRGQIGIVARYIPFTVRSIEDLGLPRVLKQIALQPRGLVLVTGPAGSGKTTTLASLIHEWNTVQGGHVITIEDPVECLVRDHKAVITQREVGIDTESFASGLRHALRQDPEVLMIGETRDRETAMAAMMAAETGHLVLTTLHTRNSIESVHRMLGLFEPETHTQIRSLLAAVLTAVVSQRLVPRADGKGMAVATEILVNTARVRDCILDPSRHDEIYECLEEGGTYGMQTFDRDLMRLLTEGVITRETALQFAANAGDFELRLRGVT